jgi:hypothetical protein
MGHLAPVDCSDWERRVPKAFYPKGTLRVLKASLEARLGSRSFTISAREQLAPKAFYTDRYHRVLKASL